MLWAISDINVTRGTAGSYFTLCCKGTQREFACVLKCGQLVCACAYLDNECLS